MPFKINLPNKIALLPIIGQVVRHFKGVSFPLFLVSITQAIQILQSIYVKNVHSVSAGIQTLDLLPPAKMFAL